MSSKKKKQTGSSKYFHSTKKGEIAELRNDLNGMDKEKVKEAVKKVIAAMTVGKDVSMLFTDVVKSMQTADFELKKLVYLYIINYARSQPDKAILVVNTFQKDSRDDSPLVRALAIRTMGCIRVDRITEYLCEPLRQALKDENPYVRKTAAVCTAKLYDIDAELVEEQDFLPRLREMISDPNPMVVANTVAALAEISETSKKDVFMINSTVLSKLLAALNECTEWGQVSILDALARYTPSAREAEQIIERVAPRLQHANSAVALSAIKVILKYMDYSKNKAAERTIIQKKLPPTLLTLLSGTPPEVQYVALRNINLIVQKRPDILNREIKHFFCKYNDPIYVKMEKLELLIKLTDSNNIDQVLLELREYASEVDVEFVRKAVTTIGRCAIKLESCAERCIKTLMDLIKTKVAYVVQEAIIVVKDIFRKYPNRYESVITTLCENLEDIEEPQAKAAMIWILGEYAPHIADAPEQLNNYLEHFKDEVPVVQLQLVTAVVKLFLRRPDDAKQMVEKTLKLATESVTNPDLRDRGYVYWRLLSTDPAAAQKVVLAERPTISDEEADLDPTVLASLIGHISTLASVYHKPPETFIKGGAAVEFKAAAKDANASSDSSSEESSDDSDEEDSDEEEDEEDEEEEEETKAPAQSGEVDILGSILGDIGVSEPGPAPVVSSPLLGKPKHVVIPFDNPKIPKVQVSATFSRRSGQVFMDFTFENRTQSVLQNFAVKFNKNFFGVAPAGKLSVPGGVAPGGSGEASLPIATNGEGDFKTKVGQVQVALKTDVGVGYFTETLPTYLLFEENGLLPQKEFLGSWKQISEEERLQMPDGTSTNSANIKSLLATYNVFEVATRSVSGKGDVLYLSLKFKSTPVLVELTVGQNVRGCSKCSNGMYAKAVLHAIKVILKTAK